VAFVTLPLGKRSDDSPARVVRLNVVAVLMLIVPIAIGTAGSAQTNTPWPVLAGIAIGFGAQSLVRDFLSGFFILVEDQYGVGDRVNVSGAKGTVEEVTLRVTRMRADDGAVWFVPNGEIRKVANTSMGWQRALVDILLPLDVDVDRALTIMAEECEAMASDPAWAADIVERPQVLGVEAMSADGLTIRLTARTGPQRQDAFARALRARIASRLKAEGIPLAKPPVVAAPTTGGGENTAPESE